MPWIDSLRALARELSLDADPLADPAETLARLTGEDVEFFRTAAREGKLEDILRARVAWEAAAAPPEGTLAGDLFGVFGELARGLGAGLPVEESILSAAGIPGRTELRRTLREMAGAGLVADTMSRCPEFFPPSVMLLVRRAEWAGRLQETFLVLADGVAAGCYLP